MTLTYVEKLRDPRWQKKRLEVLDRAGWKCELCGLQSNSMHVHHGYYRRGAQPWEYHKSTLHALCEFCHLAYVGCDMEDIGSTIARCDMRAINTLASVLRVVVRMLNERADEKLPTMQADRDRETNENSYADFAGMLADIPEYFRRIPEEELFTCTPYHVHTMQEVREREAELSGKP